MAFIGNRGAIAGFLTQHTLFWLEKNYPNKYAIYKTLRFRIPPYDIVN